MALAPPPLLEIQPCLFPFIYARSTQLSGISSISNSVQSFSDDSTLQLFISPILEHTVLTVRIITVRITHSMYYIATYIVTL